MTRQRQSQTDNKTLSVTLFICREQTKALSLELLFLYQSALTDLGWRDMNTPNIQPKWFTPASSGGMKGLSEAET